MRFPVTISTIAAITITLLIVSLSAEDDVWYSRVGRSLMDLTSSTNPLATALTTLIGDKNPFSAFDVFLKQTKRIIPTFAQFGNFTLLQAALVCAVGAIAAGILTFGAEAVYFKIANDQQQSHDAHVSNYHAHYEAQLPSIVYGNNHQQFRRNYDETPNPNGDRSGGQAVNADTNQFNDLPPKLSPQQQLNKRYPTKSLKRTQRRNQRKNKNTGDQLEKLFPAKVV